MKTLKTFEGFLTNKKLSKLDIFDNLLYTLRTLLKDFDIYDIVLSKTSEEHTIEVLTDENAASIILQIIYDPFYDSYRLYIRDKLNYHIQNNTMCDSIEDLENKLQKLIEYYSDRKNIEKILINLSDRGFIHIGLGYLLTKEKYDFIAEFLIDYDISNIRNIDFDKCSEETKDKLKHYIDGNKFDLI